jgi:hypothetical protein
MKNSHRQRESKQQSTRAHQARISAIHAIADAIHAIAEEKRHEQRQLLQQAWDEVSDGLSLPAHNGADTSTAP